MRTNIGVVKSLDKVGSLVIPKDMRARFDLKDEVELVVTDEGILLRVPNYRLTKIDDEKAKTKG